MASSSSNLALVTARSAVNTASSALRMSSRPGHSVFKRPDPSARRPRLILKLETEPKSTHAADALAVAICHALAPPLLEVVG